MLPFLYMQTHGCTRYLIAVFLPYTLRCYMKICLDLVYVFAWCVLIRRSLSRQVIAFDCSSARSVNPTIIIPFWWQKRWQRRHFHLKPGNRINIPHDLCARQIRTNSSVVIKEDHLLWIEHWTLSNVVVSVTGALLSHKASRIDYFSAASSSISTFDSRQRRKKTIQKNERDCICVTTEIR